MTPSEIAERLSAVAPVSESDLYFQAAAMIRELESERNTWKAMAENNGRAIIGYADKLKIATEALEGAEKEVDCHWELGRDCADEEWVDRSWRRLKLIREALARIKEV